MDKKKIKRLSAISLLVVLMVASAFSQSSNSAVKTENLKVSSTNTSAPGEKQKITFIELGSVRCIPCQQMQAVMKSIETKYSKDVKIEFHDVWTEEGKPYGVKYGIEAIPTQVFLDETGKEYYRHVGYFPEEELVKILQMKGVKLNQMDSLFDNYGFVNSGILYVSPREAFELRGKTIRFMRLPAKTKGKWQKEKGKSRKEKVEITAD